MTLTKTQIAAIKDELCHPYASIKLRCDDYNVTVQVVQVKPLKYALAIYINDYIKGEWLLNDCEERRRFMRPQKKAMFSRSRVAAFTKKFGKRAAKQHRMDRTWTHFSCYWLSVGPMLRHFQTHNRDVSVVSIGYQPDPTPQSEEATA